MSKDVKTKDQTNLVPTGVFDIKETMEGIDPRLPLISILHQGQLFQMPDGTKEIEFDARMLDVSKVNAWWETSFSESGGGSPPDCFSIGAIVAHPMVENCPSPTTECDPCPMNKFGSDGRGKACKNMRRVHVMLPGEMMPYRLTLPPSSIRVLDEYISLLVSKGIPYQLVTTKFSLKETKNKDGIAYSEIVLKMQDTVTNQEEAKAIKKTYNEWRNIMKEQTVEAAEYEGQNG